MRGYEKAGVVDAVQAAGGEVYAVTSEPQALAARARQDWDLPFECIGDPHHEIADAARERGWLDLRIQEAGEFLARDTAWDVTHPKGHFQPGVLVLNSDGHLLYRWRSVPSRKNAGGAAGRPTATYVWGEVRHALARQSGEDAALDEAPMLDSRPVIFPLFAALLMANGWFMRPRPFTYQGDGKNPMQRIPMVMLRLLLFVSLWAGAFAFLPTIWVSVALLLYLPIAARGVRRVYASFQTTAPASS